MPKSVLLHIGTPKTGTTSIQHSLAQAQVRGLLGGVCYPHRPGGGDNQNGLSAVYLPFEDWSPWMRANYAARPRPATRVRESYRAFVLNEMARASSAILSAEALSVFPCDSVVWLRDDLESIGYGDFHVVLYIRDPAEYYLSVVQENLKQPIDPPLVADPLTFRYPFLEIAETWEAVFPGRLLVRKFAADSHPDVTDDFSAVLNQCLAVSLPGADVRLNTSLSAEGMKILQDYRETFRPDTAVLTPDVRHVTSVLGQSNNQLPQTRPILKPALADAVRANHWADAEAVRARYGVDMGLDGHRPPVVGSPRQSYRVEDIVTAVDPQIVNQLLLLLADSESAPPTRMPTALKSLPRRTASLAYWSIPRSVRPDHLADRLRSVSRRLGL